MELDSDYYQFEIVQSGFVFALFVILLICVRSMKTEPVATYTCLSRFMKILEILYNLVIRKKKVP